MKILYVTLQFYPNAYGSGIHAYEICKQLLNLGYKVVILTLSKFNRLSHENWNGLEIYRIRLPFNNPYYNPLNPLIFWLLGKRIAGKIKADILIGHGFETSLFIKYSKIPIKIYKANGSMIVQNKIRPKITWQDKLGKIGFYFLSKLEKEACKFSDRIIAISGSIKKELSLNYNISPSKIIKIFNGIDYNRFNIKNQNNIHRKFKKVIYVGRLSSIKGPQNILKIVPSIILKYGKNIRFEFIGNGPLYKYLKRMLKNSKYLDFIKFIGAVPNNKMPLIYSNADLCIIPSYYEPFGLVALECIASNLPVLASNIGGLSEIFNKFNNDLLFSIKNKEELINKTISNLSKTRKLNSQEKINQFLEKNFNWAENALQTHRLILQIKRSKNL
ncbi:MAG: glycosyltransferase family 4 protein [Candidatus Helarchaeota archaeon]